jgi:hypothetical protein
MQKRLRATVYGLLTPIWPATVAGVVLGALVGTLVAMSVSANAATATTQVRIDPPIDPNQIITNSPMPADTLQGYLSGEVAYLSSAGFRDAVADELGADETPALTATQQGQASIIAIAATEPDAGAAQQAVDAALKVYGGHVYDLNRVRVQSALDAVNGAVVRLRQQALDDAVRDGMVFDEVVFNDRTRDLDGKRVSLESQIDRAPAIQTIESTVSESGTGSSTQLLGGIGGGLLGGLLAIGAALAWRARSGVISSPAQLQREVTPLPVIAPEITIGKSRRSLELARALYSQLPQPRTGVILVVGASDGSGSTEVARLLHGAAGEHGAAKSFGVAELAGKDSAAVRSALNAAISVEGHGSVIVDGGSLTGSSQVIDVAERADQILVVARIGYDTVPEVALATNLSEAPVAVACTRGGIFG